jgi:hypothetical protein
MESSRPILGRIFGTTGNIFLSTDFSALDREFGRCGSTLDIIPVNGDNFVRPFSRKDEYLTGYHCKISKIENRPKRSDQEFNPAEFLMITFHFSNGRKGRNFRVQKKPQVRMFGDIREFILRRDPLNVTAMDH